EDSEDYIILASHNRMVIETNQRRLDEIDEEPEIFEADVTGIFPENSYPADQCLKLKTGAQVMMLRNDRNKRYFNGKIGHVTSLTENSIKVKFADDSVVDVIKETWDNIRYKWDPEKKKVIEESIGSFVQYPVKLAWAITVHKSQGLTFDKVIADVGESFTHGQVYVALSRCTSFGGLLLKSPMNARAIKTDPIVLEFAANETPGTILVKELEKSKTNYYLKITVKSWLNDEPSLACESFLLYLEEKNADLNRLVSLGNFGIEHFIRQTAEYLRKAISGMSEEDHFGLSSKEIKKLEKELKTKLKKSLAKGQALATLMEDLSDFPVFEPLIAQHSNTIDALVEGIKKARKGITEKSPHPDLVYLHQDPR
ncbi:MAG TPA: ATP-binding domain-containing protein, partial [Lentimicrobium sp.]|nr:ATP-binding domain-containing protein [Lentimicrobium sp.]